MAMLIADLKFIPYDPNTPSGFAYRASFTRRDTSEKMASSNGASSHCFAAAAAAREAHRLEDAVLALAVAIRLRAASRARFTFTATPLNACITCQTFSGPCSHVLPSSPRGP